MRTSDSGMAAAMHAFARLRPRRRGLAITVVIGLLAGLMVSIGALPAQAAATAGPRAAAPRPAAPSPSTDKAGADPTLRTEPTLVVAVSRPKAKARLAALL